MTDYDPLSPAVLADPLPYYRRLRDESPVHYLEKYDTWFLSRFQDVWDAEKDQASFTIAEGQMPLQVMGLQPPMPEGMSMGDSIASLDPPRHTRVRAQLFPAFRPGAAAALEGRTRELARGYIDAFTERGEADAVNDLAMRISVRIACTIIGLPLEMADWFVERVNAVFARPDDETVGPSEQGQQGSLEMQQWLAQAIQEKQRNPGEDALSRLLAAEIDGRKLPEADVLSNVMLMLIGGTETLPKAFSGAVLRLAQNPDQRAQLVADPGLAADAFEEALRYDMPTQMLGRRVRREKVIQGQALRPGQGVLFMWASANRDEREFPGADRFDIHRRPQRILSFGAGAHTCLGAHVARMEGRVMLQELLARIPEYEVDLDRAVRLQSELFQGYVSLPIRFAPR